MSVTPRNPILLVDDEITALESFETVLHLAGMTNTISLADSREVLPLLDRQPTAALLLDLTMPHVSGQEILRGIHADHPEVPVIVATGNDDLDTAVACMRLGAYDYLVKPIDENRLVASMRRAIELRDLQSENLNLKNKLLDRHLERPEAFAHIVTRSPAMERVFRYLEAVSQSPKPILITGESGTGKELAARAVHRLVDPDAPFVGVNMAGLDDHMFSDTLFGHARGAYTGAVKARAGLVDKAAGGILFLDEIGDLSPASQVKLLRLIQEREYLPLGSDLAKPADVRIVAATHVNLEERLKNGQFREDLFYRLDVHRVHLPPLRERREDLEPLVAHFVQASAAELKRHAPAVPPAITDILGAYHFPGNVRELQSMVHDAITRSSGNTLSLEVFRTRVGEHAQTSPSRNATEPAPGSELHFPERMPSLDELAETAVREAMRRAHGNQTVAGRLLGISQPALSKRLKKMGLR